MAEISTYLSGNIDEGSAEGPWGVSNRSRTLGVTLYINKKFTSPIRTESFHPINNVLSLSQHKWHLNKSGFGFPKYSHDKKCRDSPFGFSM